MSNFDLARENMVKNQIMASNVFDTQVIHAIEQVDRHEFVGDKWQNIAYSDMRIPLDEGRKMLDPSTFAKILDACHLEPKFSVLDVGCGTGYSSVVLSKIVKHVIGLESINTLAIQAAAYVTKHKLPNIAIKQGDLLAGAPENAPFDTIIVNGALSTSPNTLLSQLKNKGSLVVIEPSHGMMQAVKYINIHGEFEKLELFNAYAELL